MRAVLDTRPRRALTRHMDVPARSDLVYLAGSAELDPARRELRASGRAVPIGARAFEIMLFDFRFGRVPPWIGGSPACNRRTVRILRTRGELVLRVGAPCSQQRSHSQEAKVLV